MKENLRGFKAVFGFTFKQMAGTVSYKLLTVIVAILLAGALILINIFGANSSTDKTEEGTGENTPNIVADNTLSVEKVLVLNNSGLGDIGFSTEAQGNSAFSNTEFVTYQGSDIKDAIASATDRTIILQITKTDGDYLIEGFLPQGSILSEADVSDLLNVYSGVFRTVKYHIAGLTEEQLTMAGQPVAFNFNNIGEEDSIATIIVQLIAPMLFGLMMYFMLIFYGQSVSKSVSGEKTSKLVETLLVSVRPEALIAGKVLAVAIQGLLQFVIWIAAIFAGLYGGNAIAASLHPGYSNPVISVIDLIKDNIGQSALSLPAVLLAIVFFFVGFLFYSVLAALAGSMVSKPEDAASTQALLQMPIVISFLLCYIMPIAGHGGFMTYARYIPFTAPFSVPVDVMTGVVSLPEGLLMLAVMLLFTLLFIGISARIFKGLILYNGQKINFKTIQGVLKGRQ